MDRIGKLYEATRRAHERWYGSSGTVKHNLLRIAERGTLGGLGRFIGGSAVLGSSRPSRLSHSLFLPSIVPVVASSVLWIWLLDPQNGLVNGALETVNIPAQGWFQSTSAAAWPRAWPVDHAGRIFGSKDGLVLLSLWGIGNLLIIYLAAVADIPRQLYEAAEIDGAGRLRQFWHVTLPMLTPVIFFNVVMGLIQSVQAFTQIYIVSDGQGDPAEATLTLSLHLFLTAFKNLDMGYASAMAWMLFVVVMLITWWLFRSSRHWVHH